MNTWKVTLATLVIFVAGVLTGGLLVSYADRASQKTHRQQAGKTLRPPVASNHAAIPARNPQPLPNPSNLASRLTRGLNAEFVQRLDTEVHLTSGQRERIEQIIVEGQLRNKEIMERVNPDLRREMMETQKQIRDLLTPEQRVRFEEVMKQRMQRRNDESVPPGSRPRDLRRPLPPNGERQPDGGSPSPSGNP